MDLMPARQVSKSRPTILSMFMNMQNSLETKTFLPDMVQVRRVWSALGWKVNSVVQVLGKGLRKSRRRRIRSWGWDSVMVMWPEPTFLLPAQAKVAPLPEGGPVKVFLA